MSKNYIQHTVIIADSTVKTDGETVFHDTSAENLGGFLKLIYKHYQIAYSKYFKMDKLSKLGFLGAEILLKNCPINNLKDDETAIVFANSAASLHTDHNFQQTIDDIPSPAVFVYTLANIVIGEICIKHNIKGETAFFVNEKFDVDFMMEYVNIVLSTTAAKQCILGWVEVDANENYKAVLTLINSNQNKNIFNADSLKAIFN